MSTRNSLNSQWHNGGQCFNVKINIGSGHRNFDGFTSIDNNPRAMPDILHDISVYPWPLASDSVDHVVCAHLLEHVIEQGNVEQFMGFFEELYRVCKNGAQLEIVVPDARSDAAFSDPGHKSCWDKNIFTFCSKKSMESNIARGTCMTDYETNFDFDLTDLNVINQNIVCRMRCVKDE